MGKQVRRELLECANGLLRLSLDSSLDEIQLLIDDGYYHLAELRGRASCDIPRINYLIQKIDRAERLREQKQKQVARGGVFAS